VSELGASVKALLLRGAVFSLGVIAVLLPQLLAWKAIYGSLITIPQGPDFMRWTEPMWSEVLFSARNGLMSTAPAMWLTLLGFPLLLRRHRKLGVAVALLFASQVWVNGAAWDWWAGGAYAGRRFTGCTILFGLALAALFASIAGRRCAVWRSASAVGLIIGLLAYQLPYLVAYKTKRVRWNETQPFSERISAVWRTDRASRARTLAFPFCFPANAGFALRYGRPPSQYEQLVGRHLLDECVGPNAIRRTKKEDRADLRHAAAAAFAGRNTEPTPAGFVVEAGGAEILVPLNRPGGFELTLALAAPAPDGVALAWQGRRVPTTRDDSDAKTLRATIAKEHVTRGIHVLAVHSPTTVVAVDLRLREVGDWPEPWAWHLP
jgi:hypothetical protein